VLRAGGFCITAPPAIVLQNEEGQPVGNLTSYSGYCVGNIMIKTNGVANYLVDGDGQVTEGPDERSLLGMPLTVRFDEPAPAPIVHVVSPNGGEQWTISTQHNITWSVADSSGVTAYAIDYSTNMGVEWISIQPQIGGNPQSFPWIIPPTPSPDCVMRIMAWDSAGNSGSDFSDNSFAIAEAIPCGYVAGDLNGDTTVLGGDVTYGIRYFKGFGPPPPDSCFMDSTSTYLYVAGDVNGNCEFRGSDVTRLVAYFKGMADLSCCHFFPPPPLRISRPVIIPRD